MCEQADSSHDRENTAGDDHAETRRDPGPGHSGGIDEPSVDAVESALAEALRGATAAGQWSVVAQLAAEFEARRKARAAVVELNVERKRRQR